MDRSKNQELSQKRDSVSIDLIAEGNRVLLKFLRDFHLNGFVDAIQLRGYRVDKGVGIATFGIRLRGYTGGNIDLETPMAFDVREGTMTAPVIAFIDGRTTLISQGLFDKVFDQVNLERKWVPGWMSVIPSDTYSFSRVIINDKNKYKSASSHVDDEVYPEAFEDFNACLAATKRHLRQALAHRVLGMIQDGLTASEVQHGLYVNFLGSLSKTDIDHAIKRVVQAYRRVAQEPLPPGFEELFPLEEPIEVAPGEVPPLPEEFAEPVPLEFEEEVPLEEGLPPEEAIPTPALEEPEVPEVPEVPVAEIPPAVEPAPPVELFPSIEHPSVADIIGIIKLYHLLRFLYTKLNGEMGMREAEPHYVWRTNKGNYVVISWDRDRNNWRSFDLNRMGGPEVSYDGNWMNLGQFNGMVGQLPDADAWHETIVNPKDVFSQKGPMHTDLRYVRGALVKDLRKMGKHFGSVLREKANYLAGVLENMRDEKNV